MELLQLKTVLSLPKLSKHDRAFPLNHSAELPFSAKCRGDLLDRANASIKVPMPNGFATFPYDLCRILGHCSVKVTEMYLKSYKVIAIRKGAISVIDKMAS
jgi:hypothetical protein